MKKIINLVLKPFKLELQSTEVKWELDAFVKLFESRIQREEIESNNSTECIIFSKDRALQLHALLASYHETVIPAAPIHVLYQTSTNSHAKAYEELIEIVKNSKISFIKQNNDNSFRSDLIELLSSIRSEKIIFLVDDIIFVESLDLNDFSKFNTDIFVPSLRMGLHLKRCYTLQQKQPLPEWIIGKIKDADKSCWKWETGILDWGYPLSVDGHLFSTQEMITISKLISFNAPNTFEDGLQKFSKLFLPRLGVCYRKSRIINIPWNMVQKEHPNIHGNINQDFLLDQWQKGFQIDYKKLSGFVNESVHQEVPLAMIQRKKL